jgi:hypothetical protein
LFMGSYGVIKTLIFLEFSLHNAVVAWLFMGVMFV